MGKKLSRRSFLDILGRSSLLFMVKPLWAAQSMTQFVAVRVWPASSYTRVSLETKMPLEYKYFHLAHPDRLVVDLQGVVLDKILADLPVHILKRDPYIARVRVGQYQANSVRLVFDLKKAIAPQIFTLAPVANFDHRLVIDLYPAKIKNDGDPLLALLQDYNRGEVDSAGGTNRQNIGQQPAREDNLGAEIAKILAAEKESTNIHISRTTLPLPTPVRKKNIRNVVVMLDPGHGGEDPGAHGPRGTKEKDVVLEIARRTRARLLQEGFKVHMTRDEDVFIPLRVRVAKARKLKADVFVSIHADAFTSPVAHGTGVYALSQKGASSAAASFLAKTQNASDTIGGVKKVGDKNVDTALFDLTQTATINRSLKLGDLVLGALGKVNKLHKSQPEQANFAVLKAPDIPSVLVESAFISNPGEEKLLCQSAFKDKISQAITAGVLEFTRATLL